jgi:hypothetical protein
MKLTNICSIIFTNNDIISFKTHYNSLNTYSYPYLVKKTSSKKLKDKSKIIDLEIYLKIFFGGTGL